MNPPMPAVTDPLKYALPVLPLIKSASLLFTTKCTFEPVRVPIAKSLFESNIYPADGALNGPEPDAYVELFFPMFKYDEVGVPLSLFKTMSVEEDIPGLVF